MATLTRREVAELLDVHPDTVTRALVDGLGSAVVKWGGHGREMLFDRALVGRWQRARDCTRRAGRPCAVCAMVLEDVVAVAEHLVETRHGVKGCEECTPPGRLCQPCTS